MTFLTNLNTLPQEHVGNRQSLSCKLSVVQVTKSYSDPYSTVCCLLAVCCAAKTHIFSKATI